MMFDRSMKEKGQWIFLGIGKCILVCGVVLSFQNKPGSATITYGVGIICLIFSSLPMFQSFKILGMEAVLRDKIEEADILISQLQTFIIPVSKLLISTIARSGRIRSVLPNTEKSELYKQLISNMRQVNISEDVIESSSKDWHRYNLYDLASPIFTGINSLIMPISNDLKQQIEAIQKSINEESRTKYDQLIQDQKQVSQWKENFLDLRRREDLFSLHQDIQNHFDSCPFLDIDKKNDFLLKHNEVLADLEFYSKNKVFRRPEVWLSK